MNISPFTFQHLHDAYCVPEWFQPVPCQEGSLQFDSRKNSNRLVGTNVVHEFLMKAPRVVGDFIHRSECKGWLDESSSAQLPLCKVN